MKIYLAGPIFTERDRMYLDYIYKNIKPIFPNADIYVPHRNKEINYYISAGASYFSEKQGNNKLWCKTNDDCIVFM